MSDHAPGGRCIVPPGVNPEENASDMKFGTAILCNVTKKVVELMLREEKF